MVVSYLLTHLFPQTIYTKQTFKIIAHTITISVISRSLIYPPQYQQCSCYLFDLIKFFFGFGFVIGIRLVSEWFPANELGTAEGIYGGWGNFGSAVAAFTLPVALS